MPRAKHKTAPPQFIKKRIKLNPEALGELINLFGFDTLVSKDITKAARAIFVVQHYIDRYLGIVAVEKDLPRNANLVAELKFFVKKGQFNAHSFKSLYPWLQVEFKRNGISLTEAIPESAEVIRVAKKIIRERSGENRGKPVNRAFNDLITKLRKTFRDFHTDELKNYPEFTQEEMQTIGQMLHSLGNNTESKHKNDASDIDISLKRYQTEDGLSQGERYRSGSMEALSEYEYDEYEFVTFALEEAGIPYPKNLLDLFKRVGRPMHERAEVLNQLARQRLNKLK